MKSGRYKGVAKTTVKVVWIVFLGAVVSMGVGELISTWGFREDGWIAGIGALIALYVMVVVWKARHREILYGNED